jgi:hypothetical protein
MEPDKRTELQVTEDELIAHLKGLLQDGKIKSMDSKLLIELLEKRALRAIDEIKGVDSESDLPFQTENVISGVWPGKK